ncbi:MAG: hypothetical protein AAF602_33685 [Myxococcota bacterium]
MIFAFSVMGCAFDISGGSGELGRLNYTVTSDFEVREDLEGQTLTTRHVHEVFLSLTERGENEFEDTQDRWRHTSPDATVGGESNRLEVSRATPGGATVETFADDDLIDRFAFTFDDPAELEVRAWVRPPRETEWLPIDRGSATLEVGTQIAFLTIPLDADGFRLYSEAMPVITVEPPNLAVPDVPVTDVWENGPREASFEPATFYVIDEGQATFTLADPDHPLFSEMQIQVE